MLNSTKRSPGEARLHYLDADFEILAPGDFVYCAVTGKKIPLQALCYWNVDKQEAYYDAAAANKGMATETK